MEKFPSPFPMDIFNENALAKLDKEEEKNRAFAATGQRLHVISINDPETALSDLLAVKELFQKMLPKMPREYIMRQVFDHKHFSLILEDASEQILGAVCYRPAFEYNFIEVVFFAVDTEHHTSGYGMFLFNCFKELCKKQYIHYLAEGASYHNKNILITDLSYFDDLSQPPDAPRRYTDKTSLYLLTYADNSAIGFFKKQGFSLSPVSTKWQGCIKDYDGGTLVECKLHRGLNSLRKRGLISSVRDKIFEKMKDVNEYHIVRNWDDRAGLVEKYGLSFSGSQSTKRITPDNPTISGRTPTEFLRDFILFLISNIESHSSAWPFLAPVDTKDVPDYLDVIINPIDLHTITTRHSSSYYADLKSFMDDILLMVNNCFTYNGPETQYYRCAENIRDAATDLIRRYRDVIELWGFGYEGMGE